MAAATTNGFDAIKRQTRVPALAPVDDPAVDQDAEQAERQRVEDLPSETHPWVPALRNGVDSRSLPAFPEEPDWLPRSQSLPTTRLEDDRRLLGARGPRTFRMGSTENVGSWAGVCVATRR
jgi:hypothetical protein